jgi:hypothetical protein
MLTPPLKAKSVQIFLSCPACGHTWEAALIKPGAWWASGTTPKTIANQCFCLSCEKEPPMIIHSKVASA